jgi:hypothetical protein
VLVLLIGGIYEVRRFDCFGWHMAFYDDRFRHSSNNNIKVIASTMLYAAVMVLLMGDDLRLHNMRIISSITTIGSGVRKILVVDTHETQRHTHTGRNVISQAYLYLFFKLIK